MVIEVIVEGIVVLTKALRPFLVLRPLVKICGFREAADAEQGFEVAVVFL